MEISYASMSTVNEHYICFLGVDIDSTLHNMALNLVGNPSQPYVWLNFGQLGIFQSNVVGQRMPLGKQPLA